MRCLIGCRTLFRTLAQLIGIMVTKYEDGAIIGDQILLVVVGILTTRH